MVPSAILITAVLSAVSVAAQPSDNRVQQTSPSNTHPGNYQIGVGAMSASSMASCIATHSTTRASQDAERDAQRGKPHLWAFFSQGDFLSTFVPGIDNCPVGGPMICRDRRGTQITYLQSTKVHGATCKSEPRAAYRLPPTIPNPSYLGVVGGPDQCYSAVLEYAVTYNRTAASRHPELLRQNCSGKRASIAPDPRQGGSSTRSRH